MTSLGVMALPRPSVLMAADSEGQAPAATRFLELPDGRIAFDDRGTGPLVVMVPGLGDVRGEYRFLAPELIRAGYRVVTMDLRGHGESGTGWPGYTCSALGRDAIALIENLGAGPAVLVGTSMGAGAAAWAAAESPSTVSGLVLIGPFVRDVSPAFWAKRLLQGVMIKAAFAGPWAPATWGAYYASLYPTAKPADFDNYRRALVANLREPGRMDAVRGMIAASKAEVAARLGHIRQPALVVMGSRDPDFDDPRDEAETVAGLVNGRVVMIDGAGHYPHAEMPDVTAPAVVDFLAANPVR